MSGLLLRGRDHTQTGELVVRAGLRVASALGRGGAAKLYAHKDPNEDACMSAEGPGGWFLIVADGHWGEEAARIAVDSISAAAQSWVEDVAAREHDTWRHALEAAVVAAHYAILEGCRGERGPRTTLSLALARRPEAAFFTASVGDSHLFWSDAERCLDLGWPRDRPPRFLGQRDADDNWLRGAIRHETGSLRDTRALLAATDGLSEPGIGVADPPSAVLQALSNAESYPTAERAAVAAHRLAQIACDAQSRNGAGDNIAVALAWCRDT